MWQLEPGDPVRVRYRRIRFISLLIGLPFLAAAVLVVAKPGKTIDVTGQLTLPPVAAAATGLHRCTGLGDYRAAARGFDITILRADGRQTNTALLGDGQLAPDGGCAFPFLASVQPGHGPYTFDAGRLGRWVFAEAELSRPVGLAVAVPRPLPVD